MTSVVDASALLAFLQGEAGAAQTPRPPNGQARIAPSTPGQHRGVEGDGERLVHLDGVVAPSGRGHDIAPRNE